MAETTIQFRADDDLKSKLSKLTEKFERDHSKEIRYLINQEYERVFPQSENAALEISGVSNMDQQV